MALTWHACHWTSRFGAGAAACAALRATSRRPAASGSSATVRTARRSRISWSGRTCSTPPAERTSSRSVARRLRTPRIQDIRLVVARAGPVIDCDVDGTPCAPDGNGVQFLYPAFCCDTRSFTWVISAGMGAHTVNIKWTTLNNGSSLIQNRTLAVLAVPK